MRSKPLELLQFLALLVVTLLSGFSTVAEAELFTVTKTEDTAGTCSSSDCSLREAVLAANLHPGPDFIAVPPGTYPLTISGPDEDAGTTGDLDITDDLVLTGANPAETVIQAEFPDPDLPDRILHILGQVSVRIGQVTIRNGGVVEQFGGNLLNAEGKLFLTNSVISGAVACCPGVLAGAGIYNGGVLTVSKCEISGNVQDDENGVGGGGIYNASGGTVTLLDSNVIGNYAINGGGISNAGAMTIVNTTLRNHSRFYGGALTNEESGMVTLANSLVTGSNEGLLNRGGTMILTNSTVSGNEGIRVVGGIWNGNGGMTGIPMGTLHVVNSTIADNEMGGLLVGLWDNTTLVNTILADNTSSNCLGSPHHLTGSIKSLGHNLDSDGSCLLDESGDLLADPNLGPLQNNGGLTMTHALFLGSPALDAGDDSACPPIDQRGILRPGGAACDIGAFESPKGAVERGKYCGDRLDNDRDGKIDCEDEDCADEKLCE